MKNPDHLKGKVPPLLVPQKYPAGEMSGEVDYAETRDVSGVHNAIVREKPEPGHERDLREGIGKFPVWMIVFFGAILFCAGGYLTVFSGAFRGDVFDAGNWNVSMLRPQTSGGGGEVAETKKPPRELGKIAFGQNCAACHQATGLGVPGAFPPLAGSEIVNGGEKRLAGILLHGLQGPITIEGKQFNGAMPAWGGNLSSEKIANILTYVRSEWGNKSGPIAPEQIEAARAAFKDRREPWTAPELDQIPADAGLEGGGAAPAANAEKKS